MILCANTKTNEQKVQSIGIGTVKPKFSSEVLVSKK